MYQDLHIFLLSLAVNGFLGKNKMLISDHNLLNDIISGSQNVPWILTVAHCLKSDTPDPMFSLDLITQIFYRGYLLMLPYSLWFNYCFGAGGGELQSAGLGRPIQQGNSLLFTRKSHTFKQFPPKATNFAKSDVYNQTHSSQLSSKLEYPSL